MSGVINIITRTPRELAARGGSSLTIGLGAFNREVADDDADLGSLFYVRGSRAQAVDDRWSCKLSAGYLTQDPLPRPSGTIPNALQTPYPSFTNEGTSQPKFDTRVDYDIDGGGSVSISGGVAGTEGLIHTGIGPFDISSGTLMTYLSTRYQKGGRRHRLFYEPARRRGDEPAGPRADRAAACRSCSTPRPSTSRRRMSGRSARDTP